MTKPMLRLRRFVDGDPLKVMVPSRFMCLYRNHRSFSGVQASGKVQGPRRRSSLHQPGPMTHHAMTLHLLRTVNLLPRGNLHRGLAACCRVWFPQKSLGGCREAGEKRGARLGAVADDGQQGRLATAAGAHQREHLAGLAAAAHVPQYLHAAPPVSAAADLDHAGPAATHSCPPCLSRCLASAAASPIRKFAVLILSLFPLKLTSTIHAHSGRYGELQSAVMRGNLSRRGAGGLLSGASPSLWPSPWL